MSKPFEYSRVIGSDSHMVGMYAAASQTFYAQSGKFGYLASGLFTLLTASNAAITNLNVIGWAMVSARTTATTAKMEKFNVDTNMENVFEMPIYYDGATALTEAQLIALVGKSVDLYGTSAGYQYASVAAAASYNQLIVVDYRNYDNSVSYLNQTVFVRLNPKAITPTAFSALGS